MYRKPKITVEEVIMYTKNRFQKLAGLLTEDHNLDAEKINVKDDDDEGLMAKGQLEQMASQAKKLLKLMPPDAHLEGWVQSKLTLANEMLDVVYHYLMDESSHDENDKKENEEKENEEKESIDEKRGLWDNVHTKRNRGEKPAKSGDKDYPDAKAWKKAQK